MAKAKDGLDGKITGKVGSVVFSSWKGIPYAKSQQIAYTSNTPAQQLQRKKFKLAVRFINDIKPMIDAGFKWDLDQKTPINSAISYTLKRAMTGGLEDLAIDYPKALVARGDLLPAEEAQMQVTGPGELTFSWSNGPDIDPKRATDKALLLVYCPASGQAFFCVDGSVRRDGQSYIMDLPVGYAGRTLETWLAFATESGEEASDSMYLGQVVV